MAYLSSIRWNVYFNGVLYAQFVPYHIAQGIRRANPDAKISIRAN